MRSTEPAPARSSNRRFSIRVRSRPTARTASFKNAAFRDRDSTIVKSRPESAIFIGIAGDPFPEPRSNQTGIRDSGFGIRDSGFGTRDSGFGARDSGLGIRDSGFGTRDSGFGIWDSGFGIGRRREPRNRAAASGSTKSRSIASVVAGSRGSPVRLIVRFQR
jgi:hypothetical protein